MLHLIIGLETKSRLQLENSGFWIGNSELVVPCGEQLICTAKKVLKVKKNTLQIKTILMQSYHFT
jgi:hypothetical protein